MAVACSGDWDGAPDAAQEAFGLAFRKLGDLEDPDAFPGWFATLVAHRVLAPLAGGNGSRCGTIDGIDIVDPRPPDPAVLVADADEQAHVRAAIEALPEPERAVIALPLPR